MTSQTTMLSGYRVLDLSQFLSGPLCSSTLAAFGAEVIKIEPPTGDGNRQLPPFIEQPGRDEPEHDRSLVHFKRNQNKKSIVLDLKTERGQRVLARLIADSDVLLHNYRAGVAERVGADYDTAKTANGKIIYCAIAGMEAPIGDDPADPQPPGGVIDLVAQSLSGLLGATGPLGGEPVRSRAPVADQAAGLYAAVAILSAIVERDIKNGGHGSRRLRVPMVETLGTLLWDESLDAFQQQGLENRTGNMSGRLCPYNTYPTRDGRFVAIAAASSGEWRRLIAALDLPELDRPEWLQAANRAKDRTIIDELISSWAAQHDRSDLISQLRAYGVTTGAVLEIDDMLATGPYKESVLYEIQDDAYGTLHAPRFPVEVDGHRPAGPIGNVARLGEHSREILTEVAGLTEEEIADLVSSGVAAEPTTPAAKGVES